MSMETWICAGVGLRSSVIYPHLNQKKCREELKKLIPAEDIQHNRFDLEDYLDGSPYYGLGDFLTMLDDTDTITCGDNGNGETFFYYVRSYPWQRLPNEPQTLKEVHERIIDAVSRVCDLSRKEIDALIEDDIYEEGWG